MKFLKGPEHHNPDPVDHFIGPHDEAQVEVNGVPTYALIDMGPQITTIAYSFARQLQLEVHDLNEVIYVERMGVHCPILRICRG